MLSELTSPNVTTTETQAVHQPPWMSSPASRIPIGRPRLEVPRPSHSGEDDGLLAHSINQSIYLANCATTKNK